MKKIILTSLLFSLAALVNATPSTITLTANSIDENLPIDTTIGMLSSDSGAATYTLRDTSFSFDVGEQDGGFVSHQFKVRPAGNNGDNDIIIATIGTNINDFYHAFNDSPAESLVAAINTYNTNNSSGVSAEVVTNGTASGTVRLTGWPANLNGATLIGFSLTNSSGNDYSAITITSADRTLPTLSTTLDERYFAISSSGSDLVSAAVFDFETKSTYSIVVIATDSTGSYSQSFTIDINDIDESLSLLPTTVAEHNAIGTTVGILATAGGTGPYTYSIATNKNFTFMVEGVNHSNPARNEFYAIEPDETSKLVARVDYSYVNHTSVVDKLLVGTGTDVGINDFNFGGFYAEKVDEETVRLTGWDDEYDGGQFTGPAPNSTDDDGNPIDYIKIGTDPSSSSVTIPLQGYNYFSIKDDKLITTAVLDKATQSSYDITIISTDANDIVASRNFEINVADGPSGTVTEITISKDTITNQATDGATVGFLLTNATDTGRAYALVDNTATFSISGDKLTANNPNTLQTGTISVSISTLNGDNTIFTQSLTITVTNDPAFSLDVDGNGSFTASNDGLIIFKYLLNSNANNLHTTISSNAMEGRRETPQLRAYLDDTGDILDVDGNGSFTASNDGLIIFKYLLNSNANNLHTTISSNAPETRKTTSQLRAYLDPYSE